MADDSVTTDGGVVFNISGSAVTIPPLPLDELYSVLATYRLEKKREAIEAVRGMYGPAELALFVQAMGRQLDNMDVTDPAFMGYLFSGVPGICRVLHLTLESTDAYRGKYTQEGLLRWLMASRDDDGLGASMRAWLKASGLSAESSSAEAAAEPGYPAGQP